MGIIVAVLRKQRATAAEAKINQLVKLDQILNESGLVADLGAAARISTAYVDFMTGCEAKATNARYFSAPGRNS
jgi:hypothetical protein